MSSDDYSEDSAHSSSLISAPNFVFSDDVDMMSPQPVTPTRSPSQSPIPPSSGPRDTSPITGATAAEIAAARKRKAQKHRAQALLKQKKAKELAERARKHAELDKILDSMKAANVTVWDFMEYVFNPELGQGRARYHQFFNTYGNITQVLNWWTSSKNRSQKAHIEIGKWALRYIQKQIAQEARSLTESKKLQTMRSNLDAGFVNSFSYTAIYDLLKNELAPISMHILESLATSRKARLHGERRKSRTRMVNFYLPLIMHRIV